MSPTERAFIIHVRVLRTDAAALQSISNEIEEACVEQGIDVVAVRSFVNQKATPAFGPSPFSGQSAP